MRGAGQNHRKNARDTLLFYNLLPVPDRRKAVPRAEDSFEGLPLSYEELLQAHARLHNAVYSRMELKLSDPQAPKSELAEELWEKGRQKLPPNRYFEMLCDAGRYQVICASGETPPTLQGIWTGTNHVPWSADYTRNGNEQTVILSNLPGNMFECMDSFIRYEESLIPEERETPGDVRLSRYFKRLPHQQPRPEQPLQRRMAYDVLDHRRRMERPFLL